MKNSDSKLPKKRHYPVHVARGGKRIYYAVSHDTTSVEDGVMYWRKANHIHGWFVDNVQGGKDDCLPHDVSKEHLRKLLSDCEEVIQASKLVERVIDAGTVYDKEHPNGTAQRPGKVIEVATVAKRLLPRTMGFFFGCYEYDEDYLKDIVATRDWAARMLDDIKNGVPGDIYYQSSW